MVTCKEAKSISEAKVAQLFNFDIVSNFWNLEFKVCTFSDFDKKSEESIIKFERSKTFKNIDTHPSILIFSPH